jgi:redox-sensitive bicupin YhaK (pirin superfamily)
MDTIIVVLAIKESELIDDTPHAEDHRESVFSARHWNPSSVSDERTTPHRSVCIPRYRCAAQPWRHRDSLGNDRTVESGGIQWLVAGAGALHEEVLNGDADGIFHMAQLWINLPAELKMDSPEHHAVPADQVPQITSAGEGSTVTLYAGELEGQTGPAPLPTPVLVAFVQINPGGTMSVPVPRGWTAAVCVEPLGEPIAMGGGFVMNTNAEIAEAFEDYESGAMGQLTSSR